MVRTSAQVLVIQLYLTRLQHAEHERYSCGEQLGAVVLRPDGAELREQRDHDFVPAQLLGSVETLQPDVQPPGNTWTQQDGEHTYQTDQNQKVLLLSSSPTQQL